MRRFRIWVVVATVLATVTPALSMARPAAAATTTVVSLTFDDGYASQSVVPAMLDAHSMDGTFFVNTNTIGTGGFLSWADLTAYQSDGHEIGGHTLDHADLTAVTLEQAGAQICRDRANLMSHGISATDFAYPDGHGYENPAIVNIVKGCGYNSARHANGLYSADPVCLGGGCGYPYAEANPPTDPYAIATGDNPQTATTLAGLQLLVTQAESHGGGYVPIVFHYICDGCAQYSVTQATLQSFLDWLQLRAVSGTTVQTVRGVVGGTVKPLDTTAPASTVTCNTVVCAGSYYNAPVSVALTATDAGSGVAAIRYTTNGANPTTASAPYTAPITLAATTTLKFSAWDYAGNQEAAKTQLVQVDTVAPTTSALCNGAACQVAPYAAPTSVTLSSVDTGGSGLASIRYTTDGTDPTPSSTIYSAPLSLGATTTVRFRAFDAAGNAEATKSQVVNIDTLAPVSSIACNGSPCGTGWLNAPAQISLAASDIGGAGVAAIRYTIDGSTPTPSSTAFTTPFTVSSATSVKYRATDNVGNVETTNTQSIQIDPIAPVSSIACNSTSCGTAWYRGVHVTLAASDLGGSGVESIHYTTDGTDPTAGSPLYTAPIMIPATATIKYRSFDVASNAEPTNSVLINVDTAAPASTIACNAKACSSDWNHGSVNVKISATDDVSGLASIHYTTDGSNPTALSPLYTKALKLTTTKWVKFRAYDNAGNTGPVIAKLVKVDNKAPLATLTSPVQALGTPHPKTGNLKLKVSASDAQSGITKVKFFIDGHLKATKTKGPFTYVWNASKAKKGAHNVTIKVVDAAGNSSSRSLKVTVY